MDLSLIQKGLEAHDLTESARALADWEDYDKSRLPGDIIQMIEDRALWVRSRLEMIEIDKAKEMPTCDTVGCDDIAEYHDNMDNQLCSDCVETEMFDVGTTQEDYEQL
jgi:hypothetical protein